jgi:hypothetical protein
MESMVPIEYQEMLDNEGNFININSFVKKLQSDTGLRNFYIFSIKVWLRFYENTKDSNQKELLLNKISERHNELVLLSQSFSESEWEELHRLIKEVEKIFSN